MSIATKLGRNVTYYKGLWLFNHVVLGDYVTDYKRYTTMSETTKLGRELT